jgi:glycerol uptake facilitator-like aquaporin
MIILTMIYAVDDVSGAHFNPAVTLGFFAARHLEGKMVLAYVLSQFSGAPAASLVLCGLFPEHRPWGQPFLPVRRCNR